MGARRNAQGGGGGEGRRKGWQLAHGAEMNVEDEGRHTWSGGVDGLGNFDFLTTFGRTEVWPGLVVQRDCLAILMPLGVRIE